MRCVSTTATVAALLLVTGSASAKEYGKVGTIELGGTFAGGSTTSDFDEGDVLAESKETQTDIQIRPGIGFFLVPGIALVGELGLETRSLKVDGSDRIDNTQDISLAVGGALLLPVGKARIGPQLMLAYTSNTSKVDDGAGNETTQTYTGPGVRIAGVAKMPVGEGGVITAGLFAEYDTLAGKFEQGGIEADSERIDTGFGTLVGFSIYF